MTPGDSTHDRVVAATYEIVNRHDPMRLISAGCPDDEYEYEVEDLAELVLSDAPVDERAVAAIWIHWFSELGRLSEPDVMRSLVGDLIELRTTTDDN